MSLEKVLSGQHAWDMGSFTSVEQLHTPAFTLAKLDHLP